MFWDFPCILSICYYQHRSYSKQGAPRETTKKILLEDEGEPSLSANTTNKSMEESMRLDDSDEDSIVFIEEDAQMLSLEDITEMNGGYQNGEYGGFLRRLMTRDERGSVFEEVNDF